MSRILGEEFEEPIVYDMEIEGRLERISVYGAGHGFAYYAYGVDGGKKIFCGLYYLAEHGKLVSHNMDDKNFPDILSVQGVSQKSIRRKCSTGAQ